MPVDRLTNNDKTSGTASDDNASTAGGRPSTSGRIMGFVAEELASLTSLPDDPQGWAELVKANGQFNGAFVPLVLHDPLVAERSVDAAEWAADLISSENGKLLCVAPYAESELGPKADLTPRQWNHAAAMIDRLDDVAKRFKLELFIKETLDGAATRSELGLEPKQPVAYALDTGGFIAQGFVPALLVAPTNSSSEVGDPTAKA